MSKLITIIVENGTLNEREVFVNKIVKRHHLDERPATSGPVALIRTYRSKKVVKNVLRKNKNTTLSTRMEIGGAW